MNCPRRHTCWQSKRLYWERAPRWRAGGLGKPRGLLCHVAHSLGFYSDGISFRVASGQSFRLRDLPGGARIAQQRWIPVRRIWEVGRTYGLASPFSFWPFPDSSDWWWLVSSAFLTRTSCRKITQMVAVVPGQGGRIQSVVPLTWPCKDLCINVQSSFICNSPNWE